MMNVLKPKTESPSATGKPPAITATDVHLSYRSIVPVARRKEQEDGKKSKRVEHFEALHGVSFTIDQGEIVGLVGSQRLRQVHPAAGAGWHL